MSQLIHYINNKILTDAGRLTYTVSTDVPNTYRALINEPQLVIWSGASDNTIFQDKHVNWALRALHDACHLETRLDFTPDQEIELGRIQANKYSRQCQQLMADLIYIEVAEQAGFYKQHGYFLNDQVSFTLNELRKRSYNV